MKIQLFERPSPCAHCNKNDFPILQMPLKVNLRLEMVGVCVQCMLNNVLGLINGMQLVINQRNYEKRESNFTGEWREP